MGKLDELLNKQAAAYVALRGPRIAMLLNNGASVSSVISALRADTGGSDETIRRALSELGLMPETSARKTARKVSKRTVASNAQSVTGHSAPGASMTGGNAP